MQYYAYVNAETNKFSKYTLLIPIGRIINEIKAIFEKLVSGNVDT